VQKHTYKKGVLHCPAKAIKKIYGYGVSLPVNHLRTMFIKHFKPDIIHKHTEFTMGMYAQHCAKQLNVPIVYTLHTMYDDYSFYLIPKKLDKITKPLLHAYIRRCANKASQIIGPSKKVAEYFERCGVEKSVNVVANTVDIDNFIIDNIKPEKIADAKNELGITKDDTALCFVGRIGKEKSIDVLIDYFWNSFKNEENFKLFIIGDGPEFKSLQNKINALNAEKQIKMCGRIEHENLPEYYQACDIFATASLTEMNSISLIEANASGLYTAHKLDIDNLDQIKDEVNGKFFETSKEFEAIVRNYSLLSPKEKLVCRKKVCNYAKSYGPKEFCAEILAVYNDAINNIKF
jgi:1,2-diacylglycerol 3-alpha-glucosyltransferase